MEVNCDLKQCLTLTQKPTEVRKGLCIHVCIVAMMVFGGGSGVSLQRFIVMPGTAGRFSIPLKALLKQ